MVKDKPLFSIIMPTYNSERTLEEVLVAIRRQTFELEEIEILIVDGGSSDHTREIAEKYNCIIIDNPERLPEPAKKYGMIQAKGRYACIMGSDEILIEKDQLRKRYEVLDKHREIHCLIAELFSPKDYSPLCMYMNAVGDPFTCFVYKTYGRKIQILKKYLYQKENEAYIYKFNKSDITPIGDGGTVVDLEYIRGKYPDEMKNLESSLLFDILLADTEYLVCLEHDWIKHLSKTDFKTYLKKLKFRVINNVHNVEGSGYAYRALNKKKLDKRKYLYLLYCITIVWPLIDAVRLTISFKNKVFMVHFVFTYYVMIEIIVQYAKKLMGMKSNVSEYGK